MKCPHKLPLDYIIRMQFCGNVYWKHFLCVKCTYQGFSCLRMVHWGVILCVSRIGQDSFGFFVVVFLFF